MWAHPMHWPMLRLIEHLRGAFLRRLHHGALHAVRNAMLRHLCSYDSEAAEFACIIAALRCAFATSSAAD